MSDLIQLTRIESKIDRLLAGPLDPTLTVAAAMKLTGTRSHQSFHRLMRKWSVHSFARGKYRRIDIDNAMGRQALRLVQQREADEQAELFTEGRVHRHFPQ